MVETEHARFGITRLRTRSDGADLDKPETKTQQSIWYLPIFIETRGQTDRIGKFEAERAHGELFALGRHLCQRHEPERVDCKPVRIFRLESAQERPGHAVEKADHQASLQNNNGKDQAYYKLGPQANIGPGRLI